MPTEVKIISKSAVPLKINGEGEVGVSVHTHPPINEKLASLPFRQYFTDDGTATGTSDMKVVGTLAAPLLFYITAKQDVDVWVKTISIEISDASATLSKFGNVTALTNGVLFEWITNDKGTVEIHEGLKSNWDFVRLCAGNPSFGDGAGAFRAGNVSGTSEGYTPVMDASVVFGLPYGFRLRKGTKDRLQFSVRDTTTGVDSFNIVGYGVQV
jgi:hypothetical protein